MAWRALHQQHVHLCILSQVVHHLFPGICHTHYPAIAPIVMDTCKEFNVPYKVYPTVSSFAFCFACAKCVGCKLHRQLHIDAYRQLCNVNWTQSCNVLLAMLVLHSINKFNLCAVLECSVCPFQPSSANGEAWSSCINALPGNCWLKSIWAGECHGQPTDLLSHCSIAIMLVFGRASSIL